MDIKTFKRDRKPIDEGTWVKVDAGGFRLKVRGMTAMAVRDARASLERAVPAEDRDSEGVITASAGLRVLGETCYAAVLLDWENLTDDGKPVKYSAALAKEWLTNPDYEAFLDSVVWAARQVDQGKAQVAAGALEN